MLLGRETIHRNGKRAGWLTSGGFGYTVGRPIGFGYVRDPAGITEQALLADSYALEVAGELVPATAHLRPLLDPEMTRVRA